jgi:PAS domain S-box-containing protein
MTRWLRFGVLVAIALGGVTLFLLATASSNTAEFGRYYPLLLAVNGGIAVVLLVLVAALVWRLVRRLRARRFGARLMARFALAFALMGVLPGVLMYVVSVQFLSRSIESWFDVKVDRALESGLNLGRAALDAQLADLTTKARAIALELADVAPALQAGALDVARERAGVEEALLVTASGQLVGASGRRPIDWVPELPSAADLRQAQARRAHAVIEGDPLASDEKNVLRTRVVVPVPLTAPPNSLGDAGRDGLRLDNGGAGLLPRRAEPRFLQMTQRLPPPVAANAEALQRGYRDYQELSLARAGLKNIYSATLTLSLMLAVFAAVAGAILLARRMAAPLLQLAEGTKAVAEGDFRPVREFAGNDELNVLTQSFNAMTRQLAEARDAVEARSRELENARAYLERVLTNLSAGVIVLDREARLVTANFGASRILGVSLAHHAGDRFAELVPDLAREIASAFADQSLAQASGESWQRQIEVARGGEALALLARGSHLPLDDGPGEVIVFDDITQVISAQRALAWGEVARRLAHEIKNPLTPIQLAAERLQMKLGAKLPPAEAEVLVRGASTIVNQVAAMKRMVDDFRQYARVPPAQLVPLDLNALIHEVAALYGVDAPDAVLALELAPDLPRIEGDATQLRQVIHNLVANAQDACAGRGARARIVVRTERLHASDALGTPDAVRLTVEDNGAGFAANILRRAFEPYVTTKPAGTGLGLAMVKKIVDEHDAHVEVANRATGGASVVIVFRHLAAAAARSDRAALAHTASH